MIAGQESNQEWKAVIFLLQETSWLSCIGLSCAVRGAANMWIGSILA